LQRKKVADYLKAIQEKVDDQKINGKNERTKAQARMLSDRIDEVRAAYEKEVTEALEKKKSNVHERIYGRQAPIQFYPNSSNIQGSGRAAA
jgi:hypothetical protein